MTRRRWVIVPVALAWLASTGCIAFGSAQKADTLGKGNMQFAVEPGIIGVAGQGAIGILPNANLAFRYGVGDTVDLGFRAGTTLLEAGVKILLTSPENETFALSLAPSANGIYVGASTAGAAGGGGLVNLSVPVLIGLKFGEASEFVIGPRIINTLAFSSSSAGGSSASAMSYILSGGGSLGVCFQFGSFGLMPEFAILAPLVGGGSASVGGTSGGGFGGIGGGVTFTFNVNLLFGRGRVRSPPLVEAPPPPPPPPPSPPVPGP